MKFVNGVPERYLENRERKIDWSGTLGLDIIFINEVDTQGKTVKKPYCVEINGSSSGIGLERVPKGFITQLERLFARIRGNAEKNIDEKYDKINDFQFTFLMINEKPITFEELFHMETGFSENVYKWFKKYISERVERLVYPFHSNKNPDWLKAITNNKNKQPIFIPEENRPRSLISASGSWSDDVESRTGKWVCKPIDSAHGTNIFILDENDFRNEDGEVDKGLMVEHALDKMCGLLKKEDYGIGTDEISIQEFLDSDGAEYAKNSVDEGKPQCMRLLVDFFVLENGEVIMIGNALQRVTHNDNKNDDYYIVNSKKGAKSYPASLEEKKLAMDLAKKIIENFKEKKKRIDEVHELERKLV